MVAMRTRRGVLVAAIVLAVGGVGRAADPPWLTIVKGDWFASAVESSLKLAAARAKALPDGSAGRLPGLRYLRERRQGPADMQFDVSGLESVFIGGRLEVTGPIVVTGRDGPAHTLPATRLFINEGRVDLTRRRLNGGELHLDLGRQYRTLTLKQVTLEQGTYWIATASLAEQAKQAQRDHGQLRGLLGRRFRSQRRQIDEQLRDGQWGVGFGSYDEVAKHLATGLYPAQRRRHRQLLAARVTSFEQLAKVRELVTAKLALADRIRRVDQQFSSRHPKAVADDMRKLGEGKATLAPYIARLSGMLEQVDPIQQQYRDGYEEGFAKAAELLGKVAAADCVYKAFGRLELARRTLDYVQKVRKLPQLAREVRDFEARLRSTSGPETELLAEIAAIRRRILFSHPALDFEKILINRNPPTRYSHNGDQHLGRHSRVGPGLTILTDWKSGRPKAAAILAGKLPAGATRNPDLHYDAEKVAFAFCDHTRPGQRRYFLYEAAIDGSWVRQLTGTSRDKFETWDGRATVMIEDNDPCYLPDEDIVFISTRGQSYGRCHGGRYNPAWILHRCDGNGDNIKQLSYANENEYEPSVLNDGRIVFTRWEYTNRHEMLFHMLWWCRPDGSNVSHFFGNDMLHPMMMVEARAIPGTHRVVTTAQGHHSYNTGTTVILDTNKDENGEHAITHVTPETPYSESRGWPSPHYSHPYPITEELFLVSRANHPVHPQGRTPPPANRGIYLIDPLGGRELIYEDPEVASFSPIPVRKRRRPPVLPSMVPAEAPEYGTVLLQNAYLTRNDPEGQIGPGMIKALRVIAIGVQPRARRSACSMTVGVEIPKKVLGTVPIDEYGSAYFKVPARMSLQVQTLDENGMAILTEKSLFYLQPGENRSCVGCHEPVGTSPIAGAPATMARRKPVDLTPAAGPQYPGGLSFMRTVQPVLDRYCIGCHGLREGKDRAADKVSLIHDGQTWPAPYKALVRLGEHRVGLKSYMWDEKNISRPRRFFAYRNKVSHMLVANHGKCNMGRESYMRIIEWLDVNAQCYGDLFPNKLEERRLDAKALAQLRVYVRELFGEKIAAQPDRALVNVAQIDESRILMAPLPVAAGGWGQLAGYSGTGDPKYKRMAELVDKCILRKPNENLRGWQPTLEAGGGEGWVMTERKRYLDAVGKNGDGD